MLYVWPCCFKGFVFRDFFLVIFLELEYNKKYNSISYDLEAV